MIVRKRLLTVLFFLRSVTTLLTTSGSCVLANWMWQGQPERRKFRPLGRRSCHSLHGGKNLYRLRHKVMCHVSHTPIQRVFHSPHLLPCAFCVCSLGYCPKPNKHINIMIPRWSFKPLQPCYDSSGS